MGSGRAGKLGGVQTSCILEGRNCASGGLTAFSFSFKVFRESLSFGNNESIKVISGLLWGFSEFSLEALEAGTGMASGGLTGMGAECESWTDVSFNFLPLLSN